MSLATLGRVFRLAFRVSIARVALAWAALATVASGALAEPSERTAEAILHFRKGNELYKQKAWAAALAELQESRRLHPTKNATANAAYCLRRLERYAEALDLYEALLRDFKDVPADLQEEAQRAIVELLDLVGTIEIGQTEIGARISIDGQDRGEHPLKGALRVPLGSHTVRFYKAGFEPFETRLEVAGGKTVKVDAKLSPLAASGTLKVIEQGGRALDVILDGSHVGKTPWEGRVPTGEHVVLLRGEGDLGTAPAPVTVELHRTVPLTLAAEVLASVLRVEPIPASAHVAIDSVAVGRGVWEGRLRAGTHTVEVAGPGFVTMTNTVTLTRGQRERLQVALERDNSSPFWRKPERKSRFVAEFVSTVALVPFGGGVTDNCFEPCRLGAGIGSHGILRGGYELGGGFGFGAAVGWLTAQQAARGRKATLEGLPTVNGTLEGEVDDQLQMRAVLLGGWLGYRVDSMYPVFARLNAGILTGALSDARGAHFRNGAQKLPSVTLVERHDASFVLIAPELHLSVPLSRRVAITAGIEVPILIALTRPVWGTSWDLGSLGVARFVGQEALTSAVIVAFAPGIGARYDF